MIDLIGLHINARHFPVFRAGEIFDDIVKQRVHTLAQYVRAHGHGHDASVADIRAHCRPDLRLGKGLAAEITLHHLLAGLRNRLHQSVTAQLQIGLVVFRNLTLGHFLALPSVSGLGNHVDIAYEFFIFTDGKMEWSHFLSEHVRHIFHNLTEGRIVNIHVADIDHPGQLILLAKLPRPLSADLHSGLAVDHDDSGTRRTDRLFHFPCEIKEAGRINDIDLIP